MTAFNFALIIQLQFIALVIIPEFKPKWKRVIQYGAVVVYLVYFWYIEKYILK